MFRIRNESGLAHLVAVVIIVLVAGLGFAGWRVYSVQKENDKLKKTTSQTETKTEDKNQETNSDIPAGFVEYKNQELGFRFAYPKAWGGVSISQHARNSNEAYEPVKTHHINFDEQTKFKIRISPNSWEYTGPATEADGPVTSKGFIFSRDLKNEETLRLLSADDSYLHMFYSAFSGDVMLKGAKKIELAKVPADYVDFT